MTTTPRLVLLVLLAPAAMAAQSYVPNRVFDALDLVRLRAASTPAAYEGICW